MPWGGRGAGALLAGRGILKAEAVSDSVRVGGVGGTLLFLGVEGLRMPCRGAVEVLPA